MLLAGGVGTDQSLSHLKSMSGLSMKSFNVFGPEITRINYSEPRTFNKDQKVILHALLSDMPLTIPTRGPSEHMVLVNNRIKFKERAALQL